MGEYPAAVGGDFVTKVCTLLDGRYGFHVFQISGQAPDAATVPIGGEPIKFDVFLDQRRLDTAFNPPREKTVYFCCECKWRTETADLRTQLKEFLKKALKAAPVLERSYPDLNFMFICNKPFGVDQADLQNVEYVTKLLDDNNIRANDIAQICGRIGILFVTDWFLETTSKGRER